VLSDTEGLLALLTGGQPRCAVLGTPAADAALGQRVWPALRQLLRLASSC